MKFLCTLPERLYKYLIANGYRKHRQCYIYLRSPYHVCSHVDKFNLENIQKMDIGTWASTNLTFICKIFFLPSKVSIPPAYSDPNCGRRSRSHIF